MSIMRMRLKMRGIYLEDSTTIDILGYTAIFPRYIFHFPTDASHNKILFDTGFSLDSIYTTDVIEKRVYWGSLGTSETLITTERFIYPLILKPIAVIDGTVRGSTKIGLRMTLGNDDGSVWLTKLIVSLIKIDQNANETVLGTVTQDFKTVAAPSTIGTDSSENVWHAFPYFFDVKNEKLDYNDRLILEIKPYGLVLDLTTDNVRFYFAAEVDEDNQYVDVPIV